MIIDFSNISTRPLKNSYNLSVEIVFLKLELLLILFIFTIKINWTLKIYIYITNLGIIMTFKEYFENNPVAQGLQGRDLIYMDDFSQEEILETLNLAKLMKTGVINRCEQTKILTGQSLAEIFEKPSLRTRTSFETGIYQLGGHGMYLSPAEIGLGKRESVHDVANVLARITDIIMARVFDNKTVVDLAKYSSKPVINALCDKEHPCQVLADIETVIEHKGTDFNNLKFTYVGDGNNMCNSLLIICSKLGINFACACPEGYLPTDDYVTKAENYAKAKGSFIQVETDPIKAVVGSDIVYTDVWASMGQEEETAKRAVIFADYQVNSKLMGYAKSDACFMHCLPAHRGSEVTDEVMDCAQSIVFDEAENRLHAQKAVMALLGNRF